MLTNVNGNGFKLLYNFLQSLHFSAAKTKH